MIIFTVEKVPTNLHTLEFDANTEVTSFQNKKNGEK